MKAKIVKVEDLRNSLRCASGRDKVNSHLSYVGGYPVYVTSVSHFDWVLEERIEGVSLFAEKRVEEDREDPLLEEYMVDFERSLGTSTDMGAHMNAFDRVNEIRQFGENEVFNLDKVRFALSRTELFDKGKFELDSWTRKREFELLDKWSEILCMKPSVYNSAKNALYSWQEFLDSDGTDYDAAIDVYDNVVNIALKTGDARLFASLYKEVSRAGNRKRDSLEVIYSYYLSKHEEHSERVDELFDALEAIVKLRGKRSFKRRLKRCIVPGYEFNMFEKLYEEKIAYAKEELWEETWKSQSEESLNDFWTDSKKVKIPRESKNKVRAYERGLKALKQCREFYNIYEYSMILSYLDMVSIANDLDNEKISKLTEVHASAVEEFKDNYCDIEDPKWCIYTKDKLYIVGSGEVPRVAGVDFVNKFLDGKNYVFVEHDLAGVVDGLAAYVRNFE